MQKTMLLLLAAAVLAIGCQSNPPAEGETNSTPPANTEAPVENKPAENTASTPDTGKVVAFADVKKVIEKCTNCHGGDNPKEGLDLTKDDQIAKIVKAGDSAGSALVQVLKGQPKLMPPNSPLPAEEIALIEAWVAAGAKME